MTAARAVGYGVFSLADPDPYERDEVRLLVALSWVNSRNSVTRIFDQDLVSNPGWDIMLDLFINQMRARPVFVCGLCLAAKVPQTTALRWIGNLERNGLVVRSPDQKDRRRSYVRLTETGADRMRQVLDAASDSDRRLGIGRLHTTQ